MAQHAAWWSKIQSFFKDVENFLVLVNIYIIWDFQKLMKSNNFVIVSHGSFYWEGY